MTMPTGRRRARELRKSAIIRRTANHKYNVVALDCGIKLNILRMLNRHGCNVTIVPYNTTARGNTGSCTPTACFFSNGPGDPENVQPAIELVREMRGELPIFGICLGHQVISLAYGAKTFKLKFGHRGGNHPGQKPGNRQNRDHKPEPQLCRRPGKRSPGTGLEITCVNLLDGTVEGVKCVKDRLFTVQYHPESAPGPQDSSLSVSTSSFR